MIDDVKPCEKCGRQLRHVRTLGGPMIRNGHYEVWTHTDTGYAPCNVDANGMETDRLQRLAAILTAPGSVQATVLTETSLAKLIDDLHKERLV